MIARVEVPADKLPIQSPILSNFNAAELMQ